MNSVLILYLVCTSSTKVQIRYKYSINKRIITINKHILIDTKKALKTRLYKGLICVFYLFILCCLLSNTKFTKDIPEYLFIIDMPSNCR